ncbi:hypothetical protein [Haloferula sp. BvORR071]|uniref:hypothetical protein n=1 Tax=Haloferula sp. BvORR071 TaxID=1396141 RepID=UPI000552408E|nr:hypothetical protein [Haloferula sp. BvORR071]
MRRSVTFWSGLFVLSYLFWVWWDSGRYCSYAEYSRPAGTLGIYGYDATLSCSLNTAPNASIHPGFNFGHEDFSTMGRIQNLKVEQGSCYFDFQGPHREIRLAAWIVIVLFFNAWVFLMLWSYLRRKKLEDAMLAPPEETQGEHLLLASLYHVPPPVPPDAGNPDEVHR